MAEMVSYGDRVYCVACCDSVSKILYLHFHIPGLVCVGVPIQKLNNKISGIKLVFSLYATIKMMHGPINIRITLICLIFFVLHVTKSTDWTS